MLVLLQILIIIVVVELGGGIVGSDLVSIDVVLGLTRTVLRASCAVLASVLVVCVTTVRTIWLVWGVCVRSRNVVIALFVILIKLLVRRACLPELVESGDDHDQNDDIDYDANDEAVEEALTDSVPSTKVVRLNPS